MGWIEKQRNIVDFAISSLLRRKGRNLSLLLVTTLMTFTLGSVLFFAGAVKREASVVLRGSPEMVVQRVIAGRQDLVPADYIEKIARIGGVASVKPRLWGYYYDPACGANYTVIVPRRRAPRSGEITVGRGISRARNAFEGDMLSLRAFDGQPLIFAIKEVLSSESEPVSSDLVLLCEPDFRKLFGISGRSAADLVLHLKDGQDPRAVASQIVRMLPDTRPIPRGEVLRTYEDLFNRRSGLMSLVLWGAVPALVILAWDQAAGPGDDEKKEIGILKAVGWGAGDVLLVKSWESAAVSISAFLLGILLAYAHVFLASASLFKPVFRGWSVLSPDFRPVPAVDWHSVAVLFLVTVVPCVTATVISSWRASGIGPDEVVR